MKAFHFCAQFNEAPGVMHIFDGIITTDVDPFDPVFYARVKTEVAAKMVPPRPPERVMLSALSLLAQK